MDRGIRQGNGRVIESSIIIHASTIIILVVIITITIYISGHNPSSTLLSVKQISTLGIRKI